MKVKKKLKNQELIKKLVEKEKEMENFKLKGKQIMRKKPQTIYIIFP